MELGGGTEMVLRPLALEDDEHAVAAHVELVADGFSFLPFFEAGEPWAQYLSRSRHMSRGEGLADGIVPWTDLYGVVQGAVVARVSVRHRLTEALAQTGGHIGYGVRREYRRRGYATALLRAGLVIAHDLGIDRALVTCDDDNLGSATVAERCGGVLENVVQVAGATAKRRYWVPTHPGL